MAHAGSRTLALARRTWQLHQRIHSKIHAIHSCTTRPGIQSVYMWKGKVERDEEHLLVIKTQSTLVPDVVARVKALHPYVEPEVVALPISGGSASYLAWVAECTTHKTA